MNVFTAAARGDRAATDTQRTNEVLIQQLPANLHLSLGETRSSGV